VNRRANGHLAGFQIQVTLMPNSPGGHSINGEELPLLVGRTVSCLLEITAELTYVRGRLNRHNGGRHKTAAPGSFPGRFTPYWMNS